MHHAIELAASGIETFAIALIFISFSFATVRFLLRVSQKQDSAYADYKLMLGRSMLLGLEFLVAADVIRTVALEPTLSNIGILGLLVVLRTFLSWSLVVELEGHWPWHSAPISTQSEPAGADAARTHVPISTRRIDLLFRRPVAATFPPATRDGKAPLPDLARKSKAI